jgi:hypothetical protein
VLISFEEWGEEWEDLYDVLVAESRRNEPRVKWKDIKAEMDKELSAGE